MTHTTTIGEDILTGDTIELPLESRMQGMYVLGRAGMGKTNFLLSLIRQDMDAGHGVCVLDPHGDLFLDSLACVPPEREGDVLLLDLQDTGYPFAFDLFAGVNPLDPSSLSTGVERVVSVFKRVWGDVSWGPRLEDLLGNATYTLFFNPGTTLADLPKLLTDPAFRATLVRNVHDPFVRDFWEVEYNPLSARGQAGIYAPLMNKLRSFLRHPLLSRIVSQSGTTINFSEVLNRRWILLVRLDPELEEASNLLGAAIVLRVLEAALGRRHIPFERRLPFFLYADEFPRFATTTFARFLQEARKYAVGTTLAHQFRSQLTSYLQDSVKAAANIVCFQLLSEDAREMSREFSGQGIEIKGTLWDWMVGFSTNPIHAKFYALCEASELVEVIDDYGTLHKHTHYFLFRRIREALKKQDKNYPVIPRGYHFEAIRERFNHRIPPLIEQYNNLRDHLLDLVGFDSDNFVRLPKGQAATKLLLSGIIDQKILKFSQALPREHSEIVQEIYSVEKDPYSLTRLPFKITEQHHDFVEAGRQAVGIRLRNRELYKRTPAVAAAALPPLDQPVAARLPVMTEVEIDE